MLQDQAGLDVSTSSELAVRAYDRALVDMLENRLSMGDRIKDALEADPAFVMGLVMRTSMFMQLSSRVVTAKVAETLRELEQYAPGATGREQLHIEALRSWAAGRLGAARATWAGIVAAHPTDILALRLHHFMSFWQGERAGLRDLPVATLERVDADLPGYGFIVSMAAFGNEECGDYAKAEELGRRAVAINADDLWGVHAVAHVLEMQGRHIEGQAWLAQPFGVWQDRNPFAHHVWWHTALYALELGQIDWVLEIYDREVEADERGFYLDVQNAASMLMRLRLMGVDVGQRWEKVAALAVKRTGDHVMPFTYAHFMMALAGAGKSADARAYLDSQRAFADGETGDAAEVTRRVGLALSEALLAYGDGHHGTVVDKLFPVRGVLTLLGGSHAQQDIFRQILVDAAIRAGRMQEARIALTERAALRPDTAFSKAKLALLGAA
ncbi:MAG: hypothetical protein RLZ98_2532 [Pseudomonadota bacterium]|jgi:tetratricopeptide (TPR) repeat protein